MPSVRVGDGVEIAYESIGDESAEPLLLMMGVGGQLVLWEDDFCELLADRGFRVIRYDHRDVGLSSKLDHHGDPDVLGVLAQAGEGRPIEAPYVLDDLADDAAGLLDGLGIERAHVFGISMGGMVGQVLALRHGPRVATLTSMMSTTGDRALPGPSEEALAYLLEPSPLDRDGYAEQSVRGAHLLSGSAYPADVERVRARTLRAYDRCFHLSGYSRQLLAIMAAPDRTQALRALRVPTLVIHGDEDPLVPLACGVATAEAVPDAALDVVEGLGHSLPEAVWPRIVDALRAHAGRGRVR